MKNILLFLAFTLMLSGSAFAQSANYSDIPDYLGTDIIPLSENELRALRLSESWASGGSVEPFLVENGKLVYTHGASLPTILASPMQVCDIELQAGEQVNEIIVGDTARWFIEKGQAGNTVHLFVKPIDAGLETSAIITTDRRVYHLRLISSRTDFTPYVGFVYSDEITAYSAQRNQEIARQEYQNSTIIDGQSVDLSNLNFAYTLRGDFSWKPSRVYDDGLKTYIQFPENMGSEMPILLVRKNNQDALVNYRVNGQTIVADGIFEEMVLVIGVGDNREEIRITRD